MRAEEVKQAEKPFYLSKTVWTIIVTLIIEIIKRYTDIDIPQEVYVILGAFGLYAARNSEGKIVFRRAKK